MNSNKLKLLLLPICCLVIALWSEVKGLELPDKKDYMPILSGVAKMQINNETAEDLMEFAASLSDQKAKAWYEKIASVEHVYTSEAMFHVGKLCDGPEQVLWYNKAASRGHQGAIMEISNITGEGFEELSNKFIHQLSVSNKGNNLLP